ncbi:MAG TPA: GntR family transcriptional regulator [Jatrophihabitans sp.]
MVDVDTQPGHGPSSPLRLRRASTAQLVADALREQILSGQLRSGAQCQELQLTAALGVSRNTLREGFQILIAERLLVREAHRGVFVRRLSAADVRDIYAVRRLLECAAVASPGAARGLPEMRVAVDDGHAAAARGDWYEVGGADVRFHLAITASVGSSRLDRTMRALFAELRLAFQLTPDARALHEPFLDRNRDLVTLVENGSADEAGAELARYLDEAENMLLSSLVRR